MPAWLYETASAASGSVVGFGVLDALGMRLGTVEGWVWAPDGTLAFLEVAHRAVLRESRHLVPLGYVVQVDPGHRYVHLRELTRRTLGTACPRLDDRRLPDDDALADAWAAAPTPRPDVTTRLRHPEAGVDALVPERIAVRRDTASPRAAAPSGTAPPVGFTPGDAPSGPAMPGDATPVPAWDRVADTPEGDTLGPPPTWGPLTAPTGAWQPLLDDEEPSGDTAPR